MCAENRNPYGTMIPTSATEQQEKRKRKRRTNGGNGEGERVDTGWVTTGRLALSGIFEEKKRKVRGEKERLGGGFGGGGVGGCAFFCGG